MAVASPHALKPSPFTIPNRLFALVYASAVLSLLSRHLLDVLHSPMALTTLMLLLADLVLTFMWATTQATRMVPVHRQVFPENLRIRDEDFPALDIFICTADPCKEPPVGVVNTALSVMAYDYPSEKVSVYVSDDGGSELTLFAFIEAVVFAKRWVPFCRERKVVERSPEAFFRSGYAQCPETDEIKTMYEIMKTRVENVVERGKVEEEYITSEEQRQMFNKWTDGFTRQDHPTIIQVLLEIGRDKDCRGQTLPNLVYVSRQKSKTIPHHFKAGALNTLLRVSSVMTNAPIVLTLDCDMYSNDPQTPHRALCYFTDAKIRLDLAYIQFPQIFPSLNKNDIYSCEFKRLFQINPKGFDGLRGPNHVGTGCFFSRRAFFGSPTSYVAPELPELRPDRIVGGPIQAQSVLALAEHVAGCRYEERTGWGSKLGFRYGSLVEDYYTGYRLQCEGWRAIFCHPNRPAFLGDVPIALGDVLNQTKRWSVGLYEVAFSKYSPVTFGIRSMGLLMGLCYAQYAFWSLWSIPVIIYGVLPQLTLLHGISIFPKVSSMWFFVYAFLFLGAYGQDCLDYVVAQGTFQRWWSDQRMWMIKSVTAFLFGNIELVSKRLGIPTHGFTVTSKVVDDEQAKRYKQGIFEFGIEAPMFVPLATIAIINLVAFFGGLIRVFTGSEVEEFFVQMFICGFVVLNSWPIYEAMVIRGDKGRMPTKTTIVSIYIAWAFYLVSAIVLKMRKA